MVSIRCKMIVRQVLNDLALNAVVVDLGEVEIVEDLDTTQYTELKAALAPVWPCAAGSGARVLPANKLGTSPGDSS